MNHLKNIAADIPSPYEGILKATKAISFDMASDLSTGSLLKTLTSSKPAGLFLELGTGSGLATSWIAAGMDQESELITVDNNEVLISIARQNLVDHRINFVCADGYEWIKDYQGSPFDLIFADAIPGKYEMFAETWALLKKGGFYIIDDMQKQDNWPDGHDQKAVAFIQALEDRTDVALTKLDWSTGVIIAVKIFSQSGN